MNGLTHPVTGHTPRVTGHAILRYALRAERYRYETIWQIPKPQQQRYEAEILAVATEGVVLNAAQVMVFLRGRVSRTDEITRAFRANGSATNGASQPWGEYRMKDNHVVVLEKDGDDSVIVTFLVADEAQMKTVESLAYVDTGTVGNDEVWLQPCDVEMLLVEHDGRVGFTPGKDVLERWLDRVQREDLLKVFVGWDGLLRTAEILLKDRRVSPQEIPWPEPERDGVSSKFCEEEMARWVEGILKLNPVLGRMTFIICRPSHAAFVVQRLYKQDPIPESFLEAPSRAGDVHGFTVLNGAIVKHHEVRTRF